MELEWDEKKRLTNFRKHGFDFEDCVHLFRGPVETWLDVRFDMGEPRFRAVGMLDNRVVAVAYTERHDVIRIISMRKASKHEEAYYFERLAGL